MPTQLKAACTEVYRWDNLLAAYQAAGRGKRGRAATATFEYALVYLSRLDHFGQTGAEV